MSRALTYATVCSGIECMSVACRGLPLRPVFFSEIEPFPCAVLKARYPDVPNLGDMSRIQVSNDGKEITNGSVRIVLDERIDILAGGTPCQDVSVSGKRAGMQEGSGTRSSLAFDFARLARELGPRYVIWENVAGSIYSKNAPDFLRFLSKLGDCGYSIAWRMLDAQYVRVDGMGRAVPQRRRRVWVVGHLGADESRAAEILFETDCVAGHTPPRRIAGQGFAYSLGGRDSVHAGMVGGTPGTGDRRDREKAGGGCLHPLDAPRPDAHNGRGGYDNAIGFLQKQSAAAHSLGEDTVSPTLSQDSNHICVCYDGYNQSGHEEVCMTLRSAMTGNDGNDADPKVAYGINAQMGQMMPFDKELGQTQAVCHQGGVMIASLLPQMRYIVRRLTPTECERLMGLPGDYTIPVGLGTKSPDGQTVFDPSLVSEFQRIHDTYGAIMADYAHAKWEREGRKGREPKPPKPKSAAQVRAWLEKISDPATCPDSPRYKACGNGWATNQPRWILTRLLAKEGVEW